MRADSIEVTGYPELARRYHVSSVPKTVVGDDGLEFVGAGPESMLLQHVLQAARSGGGVVVEAGERELIELRTCPLLDVATEFPDVICQAHHGLIEAAHAAAGGSADGVELVPFAAPGACHVLLPRSVPPSGAPAHPDEDG